MKCCLQKWKYDTVFMGVRFFFIKQLAPISFSTDRHGNTKAYPFAWARMASAKQADSKGAVKERANSPVWLSPKRCATAHFLGCAGSLIDLSVSLTHLHEVWVERIWNEGCSLTNLSVGAFSHRFKHLFSSAFKIFVSAGLVSSGATSEALNFRGFNDIEVKLKVWDGHVHSCFVSLW